MTNYHRVVSRVSVSSPQNVGPALLTVDQKPCGDVLVPRGVNHIGPGLLVARVEQSTTVSQWHVLNYCRSECQ